VTGLVTVYATFADAGEAERIARLLVEERLAACANILGPCRSIYRWEGKVEESDEIAALFKTREVQAQDLIARLAELHSYAIPAAVIWPILGGLPAYLEWVEESSEAQG
jgi:periplasmic divalent cation tolerance protein